MCSQPTCGEQLSSATDSGAKRKRDPSPSQNEQSGKSRSDHEGLEVHTPRTAAIVTPAHLVADLSPLLTVEVKCAIENGGETATHTRPSIPGYFPQSSKQLIESQKSITVKTRKRDKIPTFNNFDHLAKMLGTNGVVVVDTTGIATGCIEQIKFSGFLNVWKHLYENKAPSLTKTLGCLREYLSCSKVQWSNVLQKIGQ